MEVSSENSSVETISVSKMEGDERLITLTGDALGTESFTQHVYFDGETTWRNQTVDGDSTVEQLDESPGFPESGAAYRLANVLRAGNYSATAAESDNGTPTVTYTADSFDNRTAIAHLGIPDPVTALSATVTVTADGLVTSAALTVEREADQRSDTWTYEYDVRGINETTVETPDWAA